MMSLKPLFEALTNLTLWFDLHSTLHSTVHSTFDSTPHSTPHSTPRSTPHSTQPFIVCPVHGGRCDHIMIMCTTKPSEWQNDLPFGRHLAIIIIQSFRVHPHNNPSTYSIYIVCCFFRGSWVSVWVYTWHISQTLHQSNYTTKSAVYMYVIL